MGPEMGQFNAQYAAVTYPSATLQNQIMQQVEYRVDGGYQPGAEQQWPMDYQHVTWTYYPGYYSTPQQMH